MHSSSSSFRSAFGRFRFTASFFDLALPAEAVITSLSRTKKCTDGHKGSDAQVRWSDNTFVRWEVVDCIRLKTRTEGNSRCTQDLKSREKPRQSQRRKIRKGRADHGPRYRSTQLSLQHLDLTIGGELVLVRGIRLVVGCGAIYHIGYQ
ncbi:hypothetical protein T01_12130 [Trichinella spiralis]|uniref:Uncharacterized protein n=1 Tax=Trichinella spiralis TaxID=6334 RepID=A0A0V1ANC9_TRISP|nr:hypothetical protein T01_12130 [Trichinella spiralis]